MKRIPFFLLAFVASAFAAHGAPVDFNREVRPILSENCFTCHGPDSNKRKGDLRLDVRDSAFGKAKSGEIAIVPGDVEKSELLRRVTSDDKDDVMPPLKEHKKLKPAEIALLERWIKEGAKWAEHWSLVKVQQPPVPAVAGAPTPIDAFIRERLVREKLQPAPEEERARLIRRVSLDLTGLPPSVKEVDDFLRDTAPHAFEKVVDRLLASPHLGERLAIPWLDIARYGDTSGYHNDSLRDMWLWREWVINAFNANMPFSEFTIEQLAGDLLPNATVQQQIASGFHRNVMTSDEGGIIESEYLNLYCVDRVATTGVTWLGMTVACAQCHDHKYDPVTQRDFYGIYAFFHNVPENGKDGVRDRNPKPFLRVPSPEQAAELKRREDEIAGVQTRVAELEKQLDAQQIDWEKRVSENGSIAEPKGPWIKFALDADGNGVADDGRAIATKLNGDAAFEDGAAGKALRADRKNWIDAGQEFAFEKTQAFTAAAWLSLKAPGGSPFGKMDAGGDTRGWDLEFHGGKPSVHLITKWPSEAIHVQGERELPMDKFVHVAFSYDGSGKAAGVKLFVDGKPEKTKIVIDKLGSTIATTEPFAIGRRGSAGAPFAGKVDDVRIYTRALNENEVASLGGAAQLATIAIAPEQRTPQQKDALRKFFRETQATEYIDAKKRVADLTKEKEKFEREIPNTMVMAEMEKPRDTFIKVRGNYDQDGEKVTAAAPKFLPQIAPRADGKPLNRLDFAKWLVSTEHPLTARVTVNRWWAMLFGTGLVKTVNDFGSQGEQPSHPELLDWLAADFMRDWDIKRCLKQMVMSATYRQSAKTSPELLARDSENRLLARGPRHRLDAELIRDNALAVAGILNPKLGGKSIKPAQPAGTWEINEMSGYSYDKSKGDDLYRRGLYVYWRRSTVYPSFITLDAPTREFCAAQRARTSTPLQSLVLMNDPVFVEAARAFAQRILTEAPADAKARLEFAWRTALARPATDNERAILQRTLDQQLATFQQDKDAAKKLASVGDLPRPEALDVSEVAAWTAVCNVILNLNEVITN